MVHVKHNGLMIKGKHTKADVEALFRKQRGLCVYCNAPLYLDGFHRDHIVPVAQGGTNGIENIQLTCPPCNLSKGSKSHEEFLKQFEGKE